MKIVGILLLIVCVPLFGFSCYQLGKLDGRKEDNYDKPIKIKTFRDLCK